MRFGNVSHTLIKIPKFFYEENENNNNNNNLFKINFIKNYYKESKLIKLNDDLNFNRNKRIKLTKLNKNFSNNNIKNFSSYSTMKFKENNNNSTENKFFNNDLNCDLNSENKKLNHYNSISSFKKNIDLNIETLLNKIKNNNFLKNREFNKISLKKTYTLNNENKFLIKNFEETMKEKIISLTLISDKIKNQCLNKKISLETQKSFEEKNSNEIYKKFQLMKSKNIFLNKFNEKLLITNLKNKKLIKIKNSSLPQLKK